MKKKGIKKKMLYPDKEKRVFNIEVGHVPEHLVGAYMKKVKESFYEKITIKKD